ncbi:hypothetical protein FRACYDRAFT_274091 [Fragilariopsis cylindrus CCMP1102]|uniref:DUF1995 domain-containing protein n=1 Tax=Fragilariopsis cylindrus CCMP1102 TaxID=635003 RepID=A0A1E7FZ25_9STRA|nr:hypothetical protein FRACYDRAFT_274091 [Fragilariopsis cylindrus CCMP1102]|eukprot:OEU23411.1 hypothetical protein FRACYDRAFT_274091 [Fragilariopsis cylindrus CCMP1102]
MPNNHIDNGSGDCLQYTTTSTTATTTTQLYNVPPPSMKDVEGSKIYASKQSPPSSFFQLQQDCLFAAQRALQDNYRLLEIEFPPLPASVLELDDVSAYDVAQANLNLAVEFSKGMVGVSLNGNDSDNSEDSSQDSPNVIKNVAILLPDEDEKCIAIERYSGKSRDQVNEDTYNVEPGVIVSSLRRGDPNDDRLIKPEQTFLNLFGMGDDSSKNRADAVKPMDGIDMYVIIVASAQELPDVEALSDQLPNVPIIFYNLKLDVLRGDLGAPAFPPKSFQDRFLSKVKPVYYLRTRQYSRSLATPPFLMNYQGCLFRSYPGQYQTLLDTGTGSYRRIVGNDIRPGLGEFKEELTQALKDEGVLPQSEGGALDFLRVGYKTTTWWEDERPEAYMEWRT